MTEVFPTDFLFKNPLHLPFEKLYLNVKKAKGGEEQIKALDEFWVTKLVYPCYSPVPDDKSLKEQEKWLNRIKNYIRALSFIKKLSFFKFWNYVLYEPAVKEMLESFLAYAIPPYNAQPKDKFREPYSQIYDLVFSVYKRILTPQESETEFFTPEALGVLLNKHKMITHTVLWDLCRHYGHVDDGTLPNALQFAYDNIPTLKAKLQQSLFSVGSILEEIGTEVYEAEEASEIHLTDLALLFFDTAFSLNMFLKVYPPFAEMCITEKIYSRIIHVYDSDIPLLYHLMKSVYVDDNHPGYDKVDDARVELLEVCHHFFSYTMDKILQERANVEMQNAWTDKYFNLLLAILAQTTFLEDYNNVYPVEPGVELLMSICPNIDHERYNNVLKALKRNLEQETNIGDQENFNNGTEFPEYLDEAALPEHIVLESKILELKDMFPDFGYGFLEHCLKAMNMDSQRVIEAILEDNLPADVAKVDRTLPQIPPEEPEPEPPLDAQYIGKKPPEYKDVVAMLNDKSQIAEQKQKVLTQYSLVTEYDPMYDDDYEEYHRDFSSVGIDRTDCELMPRTKYRGRRFDDDYEEEGQVEEFEDPEASTSTAKPRDTFCEDPAVIRARREAKYQQNRQKRPQNSAKEVVGKPKGQGQEQNVLNNREQKNKNKSSRGNHNRRSGAQWKRSRGMVPS